MVIPHDADGTPPAAWPRRSPTTSLTCSRTHCHPYDSSIPPSTTTIVPVM
jgi:hypothetical protein